MSGSHKLFRSGVHYFLFVPQGSSACALRAPVARAISAAIPKLRQRGIDGTSATLFRSYRISHAGVLGRSVVKLLLQPGRRVFVAGNVAQIGWSGERSYVLSVTVAKDSDLLIRFF